MRRLVACLDQQSLELRHAPVNDLVADRTQERGARTRCECPRRLVAEHGARRIGNVLFAVGRLDEAENLTVRRNPGCF